MKTHMRFRTSLCVGLLSLHALSSCTHTGEQLGMYNPQTTESGQKLYRFSSVKSDGKFSLNSGSLNWDEEQLCALADSAVQKFNDGSNISIEMECKGESIDLNADPEKGKTSEKKNSGGVCVKFYQCLGSDKLKAGIMGAAGVASCALFATAYCLKNGIIRVPANSIVSSNGNNLATTPPSQINWPTTTTTGGSSTADFITKMITDGEDKWGPITEGAVLVPDPMIINDDVLKSLRRCKYSYRCIKSWLDNGLDVNARTRHNNTPLVSLYLQEASQPNLDVVFDLLRERKVDWNARDAKGRNPLMVVLDLEKKTGRHYYYHFRRLIELGADTCIKDNDHRDLKSYVGKRFKYRNDYISRIERKRCS